MGIDGDFIWTAKLRRLAALASYVSFVDMFSFFLPIKQIMGPPQWVTTCWQKGTLPW